MTVIDDLLSSVYNLPDSPVNQLRVGLFWTGVYGTQLGLASTQNDVTCCYAQEVQGVGTLHTKTVHELATMLGSPHPVESSIGMAALNALIPANTSTSVELNARDLLMDRARNKNVVTIGHFPFTDLLRDVAAQTWVLELNPSPGDVPAEHAPELLPQADVIGLTATTLLNGTFENLAKYFPSHALVVMLGPSTPLSPVLFDYGINILGGSVVDDPLTVLHYIEQGTALHKIPGLRRVTIAR
jgi:uncharacterized protein